MQCNVCNTYLNVQIFLGINCFRHVMAHMCAIACLSRQKLSITSKLFTNILIKKMFSNISLTRLGKNMSIAMQNMTEPSKKN